MPSTPYSPYARYALRDDQAPTGDLRREEFESEVSARWFTPQIDRKLLKQLMKQEEQKQEGNTVRRKNVLIARQLSSI